MGTRYDQDEQHEDDKKHDRPPRVTAKLSVHLIPPFPASFVWYEDASLFGKALVYNRTPISEKVIPQLKKKRFALSGKPFFWYRIRVSPITYTKIERGKYLMPIGKNDAAHGLVFGHTHGSVDYTGMADGHVHQCLDVTHPAIPTPDGSHIHYTEGYVVFEDGHTHHYRAFSGPAIPVGFGRHVHTYDFYTSEDDGHRHHVKGVDMPAPGER